MEVHHHPHIHHKPKPWKEYFLEFIMIFLAVTLGFFAENFREHLSDEQKGKDYAISLKEDLIRDSSIIHTLESVLIRDASGSDTLLNLLRNGRIEDPGDLQKIYKANLLALAGFTIIFTDRTSSQLKNSGGMRFITKKKVGNAILDYWQNSEILVAIGTSAGLLRSQAREKSYLIFDNKFYSDSSEGNGMRQVAANARLMTNDNIQLTEFANRVTHFKNTIKGALFKPLELQ